MPFGTGVISWTRKAESEKTTPDRVAQGGYPPWAPTDPYGHALVHTVPQTMGSLRATVDNTRIGKRETA